MMRSVIMLALLMAITACMVKCAWGAQVRLSWNQNPETDISHYEVEVGGDELRSVMATGTTTTVDLNAGNYTFAVRAVNLAGLESELSDTIAYTVQAESWPSVTASSEAAQYPVSNAIDGNPATLYASFYQPQPQELQWLQLDLGTAQWIKGIRYLPRQDGYLPAGHLTGYTITIDGIQVEEGELTTLDSAEKAILFQPFQGRVIRLQSTLTHLTCAELSAILASAPMIRVTLQRGSDLQGWTDERTDEFPKQTREFFRLKIETP